MLDQTWQVVLQHTDLLIIIGLAFLVLTPVWLHMVIPKDPMYE